MSANFFYFIGTVVVLFMVGFMGFYAYRLVRVRRQADDGTERRLEHLIRASYTATPPADDPSGLGPEGVAGGGNPPARPTSGVAPVVYERGPGLRGFTEETVFMKRDRAGEVVFQLGDKPAMPLKFLLDAHGRKVLSDLSVRATMDFGQTWGILAAEDEEGRLTVTRLM